MIIQSHLLCRTSKSMQPASWGPLSMILSTAFFSSGLHACINHANELINWPRRTLCLFWLSMSSSFFNAEADHHYSDSFCEMNSDADNHYYWDLWIIYTKSMLIKCIINTLRFTTLMSSSTMYPCCTTHHGSMTTVSTGWRGNRSRIGFLRKNFCKNQRDMIIDDDNLMTKFSKIIF